MSLSDGRAFAIGGYPNTNRVTLVDIPANNCMEMTELPVPGRYFIGYTAFHQFILGFGGCGGSLKDDLFLYNTETQASCVIPKTGSWHGADYHCILAVSEGFLYILGGYQNHPCARISLADIHSSIPNHALKSAFGKRVPGTPEAIAEAARLAALKLEAEAEAEAALKLEAEAAEAEAALKLETEAESESAQAARQREAERAALILALPPGNEELRELLALPRAHAALLAQRDAEIATLAAQLAEGTARISELSQKLRAAEALSRTCIRVEVPRRSLGALVPRSEADAEAGELLRRATELHRSGLPRPAAFREAYDRVFAGRLAPGVPAAALLSEGSAAAAALSDSFAAAVTAGDYAFLEGHAPRLGALERPHHASRKLAGEGLCDPLPEPASRAEQQAIRKPPPVISRLEDLGDAFDPLCITSAMHVKASSRICSRADRQLARIQQTARPSAASLLALAALVGRARQRDTLQVADYCA